MLEMVAPALKSLEDITYFLDEQQQKTLLEQQVFWKHLETHFNYKQWQEANTQLINRGEWL